MVLPQGETSLPLGKAAPAPIEPTKDELKALVRRLQIESAPSDNVLAHIVARAAFEAEPVGNLARIARALGQVMRRPPHHALQIMAPALKRAGARHLFGDVRRALDLPAPPKEAKELKRAAAAMEKAAAAEAAEAAAADGKG